MLKLNGGLGTSMGLDKAKSLLKVKGENTFLDLTAKQITSMRKEFGLNVKFMLMNSFNTSKDTLNFLSKYPSIISDPHIELMQNKVPLNAPHFSMDMTPSVSHRLIRTGCEKYYVYVLISLSASVSVGVGRSLR